MHANRLLGFGHDERRTNGHRNEPDPGRRTLFLSGVRQKLSAETAFAAAHARRMHRHTAALRVRILPVQVSAKVPLGAAPELAPRRPHHQRTFRHQSEPPNQRRIEHATAVDEQRKRQRRPRVQLSDAVHIDDDRRQFDERRRTGGGRRIRGHLPKGLFRRCDHDEAGGGRRCGHARFETAGRAAQENEFPGLAGSVFDAAPNEPDTILDPALQHICMYDAAHFCKSSVFD